MSNADPFDVDAWSRAEADRKSEADRARKTEDSDVAWLMADPRGRRIARRWLSQAGVWRLSFAGDPSTTAFHEGQRNVGLWLLDQLTRQAPEEFARMTTEELYERDAKHELD